MRYDRCYSDLIKLPTFMERFEYLKLQGSIGVATFGFDRYLNQALYGKSKDWKKIRGDVIIRDQGFDLGCSDHLIVGKIIVHHMNPITEEDILERNPDVMNPEYLISTCITTHNAIHYSDESILMKDPIVRKENDTIPWR